MAQSLQDTGGAVVPLAVNLLVGLGRLFEGNWSEGSRILAGVIDDSRAGTDYAAVLQSGRAAMYLGRLDDARPLRPGSDPGAGQLEHRPACADAQPAGLHRLLLGRLPDAEMHGLEGLRLSDGLGLDAGVAWPAWPPCTPTGARRRTAGSTHAWPWSSRRLDS